MTEFEFEGALDDFSMVMEWLKQRHRGEWTSSDGTRVNFTSASNNRWRLRTPKTETLGERILEILKRAHDLNELSAEVPRKPIPYIQAFQSPDRKIVVILYHYSNKPPECFTEFMEMIYSEIDKRLGQPRSESYSREHVNRTKNKLIDRGTLQVGDEPMSYNLKNIRALLTEGFSDAHLRRFCFDEPAFRPVHADLSGLTGKAGIVEKLVEYAEQRDLLDSLLNWAKGENPSRYAKHQPYQDSANEPVPVITVGQAKPAGKEIFISYAWGGESEQIVNQLDQAFQAKDIPIVRDKRDLGFKGRIKEFMERIGRGKAVIAVINDKYLKSPNCMFELVQIAKNGQFYDRIFPIVLTDAQIYDPVERIEYVKHWEEKINKLNEAMKGVSLANLQGFRDEIDQYTEIRNTMAELVYTLKDMNTLTPEMHSELGFEELFKAVERKLAE